MGKTIDVNTLFKSFEQDRSLEEAVLGALLIDADAFSSTVKSLLNEDCFYQDNHKAIYNSIVEISNSGYPVDLLTVTNSLKVKGKIESIGGAYYLVELTNRIGSAANVEYHARILRQYAIKRGMQSICLSMLHKIPTEDCFDLFEEMKNRLQELNPKIQQLMPLEHFVSEYKDMGSITAPAIFQAVDIPHFNLGAITVFGARPKAGKTITAISIICDLVEANICHCGFISLEYNASRLAYNFPKSIFGENRKKVMTYDNQSSELTAVIANIKEMVNKGIQFIALDYFSLITIKGKSGPEVIKQACQEIQSVVRDLPVHLLVLQQFRRPNTVDKLAARPTSDDYADSDGILRMADVTMGLHNPNEAGIANFDGSNSRNAREMIVFNRRDYHRLCQLLGKEQLINETIVCINEQNRIVTQNQIHQIDEQYEF